MADRSEAVAATADHVDNAASYDATIRADRPSEDANAMTYYQRAYSRPLHNRFAATP
jgi:hypothetical protein